MFSLSFRLDKFFFFARTQEEFIREDVISLRYSSSLFMLTIEFEVKKYFVHDH